MRTVIIKNDSGSSKTYIGQVLADQETYQLQTYSELEQLRKDSSFVADVNTQDAVINNGVSDFTVITEALDYLYKDDYNPVEIDLDKRQIVRAATTYKGWRYIAHPLEITTASLSGVFENDWTGTNRNNCTIQFYDDTDTEITSGLQTDLDSNCVKTIVTFAPSFDLDIIGGNVHQHITPTLNTRLWVIAGATDLKHLPGTVKEFVGGINFKFILPGDKIETDGRASARLNVTTEGVPTPTNKMQYIITHPVGYQHELMIVVEYFRA